MEKEKKHQREYYSKQQNMNSKTVLELGVHLWNNLKYCSMQSVKGMAHQLNFFLQTLTVKSCLPLVINTFNGGMLTLLPCCSTTARMAF